MIDEPLLAIDLEWYYEFIVRSEDGGKVQKPLSMNYIGKHVKNIKRVLGWAEEEGQAIHPAYRGKSFKVHQEQATDVYLTEDELARMRDLDLTPHPKGIALSRNLFMIGCYTGLRVSDYSRLQADQFHMRNGGRGTWKYRPRRPTKRWSYPCTLWWMKSCVNMQPGFHLLKSTRPSIGI